MGKNYRRNNGAPSRKGNGVSSQPKRFKVKYGSFTLEGTGNNAASEMQRAGIVASSTYGMLKQTDQSHEIGSMIGKMLFGEIFGGNGRSPITENSGDGNDNQPGYDNGNKPGEMKGWIDTFHQSHPMPSLQKLPYELGSIISSFPIGYAVAMLLHVLAMFGAICFSRIRAKYLDGKLHSPSIQVVIEALSGAGKGKFKDLFDILFSRVKEDDDVKYAADDGRGIIQIVGITISAAKFFQATAANNGVHMYMFHPEISHVADKLKKSGGLSYEHLRCAFDNDEVEYNTMTKNNRHGRFRVYLNYTFTGTPTSVDRFIAGEEVDGTAQRICWSAIPENDNLEENEPDYPEGEELEYIQDRIDEWRRNYCYNNEIGNDTPCPETIIDLEYVKKALAGWICKQGELADEENNPARKAAARREAAIAFHLAMVLHMLYDQPQEESEGARQNVVDFTLYLADYCMERYLHRFGKIMNQHIRQNREKEQVNTTGGNSGSETQDRMLSPKELYDLYHQNVPGTNKLWSYMMLSKAFPGNGTDVTIMAKVNNYAADNDLLVRGKPPKRTK